MGHSKKQDEKYDAKMAYNKNLSKGARLHYLENNIADHKGPSAYGKMHDSPMSMGGSFMSKHAGNSYFHKQNLLDDMPIDDHAGGPLKQTEVSVYDDRKNKQGQTQSEILNSAGDKVNKAIEQHNQTEFTSQERVDASKRMIDDFRKNYTTKVDSINNANSKMNKLINEMNKGNYPGSLQN